MTSPSTFQIISERFSSSSRLGLIETPLKSVAYLGFMVCGAKAFTAACQIAMRGISKVAAVALQGIAYGFNCANCQDAAVSTTNIITAWRLNQATNRYHSIGNMLQAEGKIPSTITNGAGLEAAVQNYYKCDEIKNSRVADLLDQAGNPTDEKIVESYIESIPLTPAEAAAKQAQTEARYKSYETVASTSDLFIQVIQFGLIGSAGLSVMYAAFGSPMKGLQDVAGVFGIQVVNPLAHVIATKAIYRV